MEYEILSAKEAKRQSIFFNKNTNLMSYKDKLGIIHTFGDKSSSQELIVGTTFSDLQTLVTESQLSPGTNYFITDNGVMLTALTESTLSSQGIRTQSVVHSDLYYNPDTASVAVGLGVWTPELAPLAGARVVWGGRVWINTSSAVGTADDTITLSAADWELEEGAEYYQQKTFNIEFDFVNNWISCQSDNQGNILSETFEKNSYWGVIGSLNFADYCDWGNLYIFNNTGSWIINNANQGVITDNTVVYIHNNYNSVDIFGNFSDQIFNNSNTGHISKNIVQYIRNNSCAAITQNVCQTIDENTNTGDIIFNRNGGVITQNSNPGDISTNSNTGNITLNSKGGTIIKNSNTGDISNNSGTGDIYFNTNNGDISGNENLGGIYTNSNNGQIGPTTDVTEEIFNNTNNGSILNGALTPGNINDVIVDK
jgi:hypothetical protein